MLINLKFEYFRFSILWRRRRTLVSVVATFYYAISTPTARGVERRGKKKEGRERKREKKRKREKRERERGRERERRVEREKLWSAKEGTNSNAPWHLSAREETEIRRT